MRTKAENHEKVIEKLEESFQDDIDALFDGLEAEEITKFEFEDKMLGLLAAFIAAAYMSGAGGEDVDKAEVEKLLESQAGYLSGFISTMLVEGGINPAWRSRAKLYAGSVVPAFWRGRYSGLPAYPGEGSECLQNCKCWWNIVGSDAYWELSVAEHCPTCLQRNKDWYPYRLQ